MPVEHYIVAHKPFHDPGFDHERIIQVGNGSPFSMIRDNTGDSIAEKNPTFCELSALYWIWKNDRESEAVSINHYRRFFKDLNHPGALDGLLEKADFVVPKKVYYKETVLEQYALESGFEKDLLLIRDMLEPKQKEAFDTVMNRGWLYQYNMMACSKKDFDAYCAWLFPLLFQAEKEIDLSGYNAYQKRIFGFMAERLFNVYLEAFDKKVIERPVVQSELPAKEKARIELRGIKNRIVFAMHERRRP